MELANYFYNIGVALGIPVSGTILLLLFAGCFWLVRKIKSLDKKVDELDNKIDNQSEELNKLIGTCDAIKTMLQKN